MVEKGAWNQEEILARRLHDIWRNEIGKQGRRPGKKDLNIYEDLDQESREPFLATARFILERFIRIDEVHDALQEFLQKKNKEV